MSDNAALLSGTDDRRQGFHCGEMYEREHLMSLLAASVAHAEATRHGRRNHGTRDELFSR